MAILQSFDCGAENCPEDGRMIECNKEDFEDVWFNPNLKVQQRDWWKDGAQYVDLKVDGEVIARRKTSVAGTFYFKKENGA